VDRRWGEGIDENGVPFIPINEAAYLNALREGYTGISYRSDAGDGVGGIFRDEIFPF
jgi:hypothetical protein